MEYTGYETLPEALEEKRRTLLSSAGLTPGAGTDYTVIASENGEVCGCASLCANTVRYVAVGEEYRGMNIASGLISAIRRRAFSCGISRLFIYTKPKNLLMFEGLNFHPVAECAEAVLLEDRRDGAQKYAESVPHFSGNGLPNGGIVMNANPFTVGHRWLVEKAAAECGHLYVFVTDDASPEFSPSDRLEMVRRGCADLENVTVVTTGGYLVSSASFPDYFLRKETDASAVQCELDCRIFGKWFVPELGIAKRYVGTEPFSALTAEYNGIMKKILPEYGVEVREIPRMRTDGKEVSASDVRRLIAAGDTEKAKEYLPGTSWDYIGKMKGKQDNARI